MRTWFISLSGFVSLNGFKGIRNQIDEVIKSLLEETKDECEDDDECQKKLKKIVQKNLRGVSVKRMLFKGQNMKNSIRNSKPTKKGEFGDKAAAWGLHLRQWLYSWYRLWGVCCWGDHHDGDVHDHDHDCDGDGDHVDGDGDDHDHDNDNDRERNNYW